MAKLFAYRKQSLSYMYKTLFEIYFHNFLLKVISLISALLSETPYLCLNHFN